MDQGDEVSVLSLYHALPVLAKQEQHGASTVGKHGGMCCSIACNTRGRKEKVIMLIKSCIILEQSIHSRRKSLRVCACFYIQ